MKKTMEDIVCSSFEISCGEFVDRGTKLATLDSLEVMEALMYIENELNKELPLERFRNMEYIADIINYLETFYGNY